MSIAGKAVGYGFISADHFASRIQDVKKLLIRTAERKLGQPYRDKGNPGKELLSSFGVFLSQPRAASFAVTFRIGGPSKQSMLDPSFEPVAEPEGMMSDIVKPLWGERVLAKGVPGGRTVALTSITAL